MLETLQRSVSNAILEPFIKSVVLLLKSHKEKSLTWKAFQSPLRFLLLACMLVKLKIHSVLDILVWLFE